MLIYVKCTKHVLLTPKNHYQLGVKMFPPFEFYIICSICSTTVTTKIGTFKNKQFYEKERSCILKSVSKHTLLLVQTAFLGDVIREKLSTLVFSKQKKIMKNKNPLLITRKALHVVWEDVEIES